MGGETGETAEMEASGVGEEGEDGPSSVALPLASGRRCVSTPRWAWRTRLAGARFPASPQLPPGPTSPAGSALPPPARAGLGGAGAG